MRLTASILVAGLFLGACGGDDGEVANRTTTTRSAPTTTRAPDCPSNFSIPLEGEATEECRLFYMRNVAEQENVELTDDAEVQATALCREIGISGIVEAMANAILAWDEGSRPKGAAEDTDFIAIAIGLYCPEHYDELLALD